ncbi:hypothetical protein CRYUN_Cryun20dG0045000 [Craigia yunnanensis]
MGSKVNYEASSHWCTTMLYSANRIRLFFCGIGKDGEYFLIKWNESEGAIKKTYMGFRKILVGVVSFDTTQKHLLAAGEHNQIELWDIDNINLLIFIDIEGGLSSLSYVRFNKQGNLIAVTTTENGFKILSIVVWTSSFDLLRTLIISVAQVSSL